MERNPLDRIMGVETEFGCYVEEELGHVDSVVETIKDYVFEELRLGALDVHSRDDVFEPAMCGGFLINGSRFYIDAVGSHLEYATAECLSLADLVANDRAGQRLILRAINEMGLSEEVSVYNNSVDHFGGHTFGCHENFLVHQEDFVANKIQYLMPFLVTRQIFAGVGRVGGHILTNDPTFGYEDIAANPIDYIWVSRVYGVEPDYSVNFQLSQRADHILKTVATRVRFNRAIVNPKWEHLYSNDGTTRLHLLYGEANQNEYAYALKIGTTSLVLQCIEDDLIPEELLLANPLHALREVSRDPDYRWKVTLLDGSTIRATDLQREYLKRATRYKGSSSQVDWVLAEWEAILDGLDRDPLALGDKLDWVAKLSIVNQYCEEMVVEPNDEALHSVDLEYHNIDPEKSLYSGYAQTKGVQRYVSEMDIIDAMTDPPTNTRASLRAKYVKEVLKRKGRKLYMVDWNGVILGPNDYIDLTDPYQHV